MRWFRLNDERPSSPFLHSSLFPRKPFFPVCCTTMPKDKKERIGKEKRHHEFEMRTLIFYLSTSSLTCYPEKSKGQHLLKNPLIIDGIVQKVWRPSLRL